MELSQPLEKRNSYVSNASPIIAADQPLWKNKGFLWILSGNTISVFGDCFSGIAISLWVLQTTGSAIYMAAIQICYMATGFLFGSFAGTVADRVSRRKLMLISDVIRGSTAASLAFCIFFLEASFVAILVLITLSAFSSLFQAPAFHASVSHLVGKEKIQQATSTVHLSDNLARISGLALAGVVVAVFGGIVSMIFNSITFFLSAICVLMAGAFPSTDNRPAEKTTFMKDWKSGFAYIARDPLTRSIVILSPMLILFFMSSLMLIQVMAIKEWKASPVAFGLIEMCVPLGYMIGAALILAFSAKLGRRGRWVFMGLIFLGPNFYFISIMPSALTAIPLIFTGGILFAFCSMMLQIILRTEVRVELQGRIYGSMGAITSVAPAIGLVVTSVLADNWGATVVLGWQGLLLFVMAVVSLLLLKPIREYR